MNSGHIRRIEDAARDYSLKHSGFIIISKFKKTNPYKYGLIKYKKT